MAIKLLTNQSTTRAKNAPDTPEAGPIIGALHSLCNMRNILLLILAMFTLHATGGESPPFADLVLVEKSKRKMYLLHEGKRYREYDISLGDNPIGHKQEEGDERTPEGNYKIDYRNPNSKYHLSLHITYPNAEDKASAKERGVNPGGDIFIHGLPNGFGWAPIGFTNRDWTNGCIAVTNSQIKEIWELVKNGTPIEVLP